MRNNLLEQSLDLGIALNLLHGLKRAGVKRFCAMA